MTRILASLLPVALFVAASSEAKSPSFKLHDERLSDLKGGCALEDSHLQGATVLDVPGSIQAEVWRSALFVLAQTTVIADVDTCVERKIARFLLVDGVAMPKGRSGSEDKGNLDVLLVDMPFVLSVEAKTSQGTEISIWPRPDLLSSSGYSERELGAIDEAMRQKASWLLNRIATQATASRRWRWLRLGDKEHDASDR